MSITGEIVYKNPVYVRARGEEFVAALREFLQMPYTLHRKAWHGHHVAEQKFKKMVHADGTFLAGFVRRVGDHFSKIGYSIVLKDVNRVRLVDQEPTLPGIELREDQKRLIKRAVTEQRGLIVSPTGSGKTVMIAAVLSCLDWTELGTVLVLCHNTSLQSQLQEELETRFNYACTLLGGGHKLKYGAEEYRGKVIISTVQSAARTDFSKFDFVDVVIVDEAHHVHDIKSQYFEVLSRIPARMRLGFTATPRTEDGPQMVAEGLLGPILDQVTVEEGIETGILAKPKIKLIKIPFNQNIRDIRVYPAVYEHGVVHNLRRNRIIGKTVMEFVKEGKTVLIYVNQIDHGHNLLLTLEGMGYNDAVFIRGETETDKRDFVKRNLNDKVVNVVIATTIWKEGINIPTLNVIVNAAGSKSEIAVLQTIGRGFRKAEGKDEVTIVDFFDPSHPYLISHFGERITLYMDKGWL